MHDQITPEAMREKLIKSAMAECYVPTDLQAYSEFGRDLIDLEISYRNGFQAGVQAVLAAIEAQGMAVVPVKATEQMIVSGIVERQTSGVPEAWDKATVNIYAAMIAAGRI